MSFYFYIFANVIIKIKKVMIEYTVKVHPNGTKEWYINGKRHREDGPAIEYGNGNKSWYLNGKKLTEDKFNKRKNSCNGKIVEIDGKKYKLKLIK